MGKIMRFLKRFMETNNEKRVRRLYNRELNEAIKRKNEVMFWIYDVARYGPFNK